MRKALILMNNLPAGVLSEIAENHYQFSYQPEYQGAPISLTMPVQQITFEFKKFPPFFEGLLPEGIMLEALLRKYKLDKDDFFGQLLKVGNDVIGAVTIEEIS